MTATKQPPIDQKSPRGARERHWRSLAKAISWRVTGSIDTFMLAFLFTHNLKLSATIGAAEILTKTVLYYFHERIWLRIGFGLQKASESPGAPSTTAATTPARPAAKPN